MDSIHPEQCDMCFTLRFDTYCGKCNRHLCNACNHGHSCKDDAGLIARQAKQKNSYKTNATTGPIIEKYKCKEHTTCEYNRFCGTCGIVCCQECCENDHAEHEIESIPTAFTKSAPIVKNLMTDLQDDMETATKLISALQDIISESALEKQIKDVKALLNKLEKTLINGILEKQKDEKQKVNEYIKELESCINAWDKNMSKISPLAREVNAVPFLLGFCDYIHDHDNVDFPEAIETNFLPYERLLHFEEYIEKDMKSLLEFVSSISGIYAVAGVESRVVTPRTISDSTERTTRIHKLFTKHPRKQEHTINESYVKHVQKELEAKEEEIEHLNVQITEMFETTQALQEYADRLVNSNEMFAERKIFLKSDKFHLVVRKVADGLQDLKQKTIDAVVDHKSLMHQYQEVLEEKEDLRQRFIQMAGRTLSSGGSSRSPDVKSNQPAILMPKHIIEMFNQLYKEEWKEALDMFTLPGRWQANIVIKHLYLVIQTCYKACIRISENNLKTLLSALLFIDGEQDQYPKIEMKHAREFRKSTATVCGSNLQKVIKNKTEFQAILLKWENKDDALLSEIMTTPYFNKCVYLSWLMAIQNPPMFVDEGPDRRSYINRDLYQEYTKRGSIIDYCVWPALFVEKDGPLGSKGCVQVY